MGGRVSFQNSSVIFPIMKGGGGGIILSLTYKEG